MNNKERILKTLRELQGEVKSNYKVREMALFGSVVRQEQRGTSDLDILVDFGENADLLDLVGLALFLEERLKRKVDVVPKRALREEIKDSVLTQAVLV